VSGYGNHWTLWGGHHWQAVARPKHRGRCRQGGEELDSEDGAATTRVVNKGQPRPLLACHKQASPIRPAKQNRLHFLAQPVSSYPA